MPVTHFGHTAAGAPVRQVEISGGGLTARLIEWGCVLRDLRMEGVPHPLTLGLNSMADYETRSPHFGAIAGRCANRIAHGRFEIDGLTYQATRNQNGEHTLHGGAAGFGKTLWRLEDHGPAHAEFRIVHAAGQEGFPGEIQAACRYELVDGAVIIDLTASADRPTLCNMAQHSYFNLSGASAIDDHTLWLAADRYTPVDGALIPTGETPPPPPELDFTRPQRLSGPAIDLNFCLADARRPAPVHAATLTGGGVEMRLDTTEPGIQVYTGDKVGLPAIGLDGRNYGARAGVCLEAQLWPDAPNHAGFPSAVLRPGQVYAQKTILRFARV